MNNRRSSVWVTVAVLASMALLMPMMAMAADADPLQDFCVADNSTTLHPINGFPCKAADKVYGSDFKSRALSKRGLTTAPHMAKVTPATVKEFLGLNTLGISAARIDFDKGDINPPHTHPRATELLFLAKGELYVGFVDTNKDQPNLFATTLKEGELFVFPRGLVHFQLNTGHGEATAFVAFNSQNPGTQQVAAALFKPEKLKDEVLKKGFRIHEKTVKMIRKEFRT